MVAVPIKIPSLEEIRQARKKRLVIAMLTVFGDESADEKQQRVFAVAGIMGTQEEWDTLNKLWLNRTGGKPFHATDCDSNQGQYRSNPEEENKKLYADLTQLLAKTKMLGYCAVLDIQAYKKIFHNEDFYHLCFQDVVVHFGVLVRQYKEKVKFIFHVRSRTKGSCADLFDFMQKTIEWEYGPYLNEVGFASSKDHPELQAADLLSHEVMKHCDNFFVGPAKFQRRKSMETLFSTGRHSFKYFKQEFADFSKNEYPLILAEINIDDYRGWLEKNHFKHSTASQYKYLARRRVRRV